MRQQERGDEPRERVCFFLSLPATPPHPKNPNQPACALCKLRERVLSKHEGSTRGGGDNTHTHTHSSFTIFLHFAWGCAAR